MAKFEGPCGLWPNGGSQLQTYLNTTENDVARICLLPSINKWSKVKPVPYNSYVTLTNEQRKNAGGHTDGYLYGVRIRFLSTNFSEIHTTGFEYAKPYDYFRLDDFYGYDKDATADVSCYLGFETIYRDVLTTSTVYIDVDYLGNNTTGIPIKNELKSSLSMSGATDAEAFSYVYPFILVDDYLCALAAMKDNISGEYIIDPICKEGTWKRMFYCDFGKLHDTYGLALGDVKVSILLVGTYNADTVMAPYLDGEWHDMGGVNAVVLSRPFYPCPPETGMTLEVKDFGKYAPDIILSMPTTAGVRGFNIGYAFASTPTDQVVVNYSVKIKPTAGTPVTNSFTYTPGGTNIAAIGVSWTALGMAGAPASGTLLQVEITVTYHYVGVPQSIKTATATSSIIVDTSGGGGVLPLG